MVDGDGSDGVEANGVEADGVEADGGGPGDRVDDGPTPGGTPPGSPVEQAFGAYLADTAARADRLRAEASRSLVTAARQAAGLGWSQRRIAAALGRSQPEVGRLLRRVDLVHAPGDVELADGGPHAPTDAPAPETMLSRVLGRHRDAIVATAARNGGTNVRVFGSVARGEDGPESDVDLLVDLDPGTSLFDLGRMEVALVEILGRPVDVVPARMLKPRVARTVEAIAL
ncbi:nucleotidyltransferase domain-containing protein [Cellulomonas sp. NPDC058312]|uniref:nucleotidyltransferase domain-containing protein n=1 Tax=Cellulomonas sp. NPDC058312 TaxID=3346441 RepID=UPI0036E61A17